jgi:hypothetical protein
MEDGLAVGAGVALAEATVGATTVVDDPSGFAEGSAVAEAAATTVPAELGADGLGSAIACGTTTTTASIRMTQAVASIRNAAGRDRFNWFLWYRVAAPDRCRWLAMPGLAG